MVYVPFLQWRWSTVKYRGQGQGQSGQGIKLFQITPYVNDFQTLDNSGSWQPVGASKNSFYLPFLTQVFHTWRDETCRVIQQQFWMKECDILRGRNIPCPLLHIFRDPNPKVYDPASWHSNVTLLAIVLVLTSKFMHGANVARYIY